MQAAVILVVLALLASPASAGPSAACKEDLAAVDASFAETLDRLDSAANASPAEKCAAYRHHVEVMKAGREVFLRCLAGHDQSENVGQLEVSIEDFLVVIGNKCPKE